MGAVERLGHDQPEHRVAEELEPLVGGQAAVLVGVGAVGQGAVEQLGVQSAATERLAQVVVALGLERLAHGGLTGQRTGRRLRARAVLAALRAGAVRQVLGAARRVRAGHERRRDGLPLRPAVPRVAPRHLPLRDSHFVYSSVVPRSRPVRRLVLLLVLLLILRACWPSLAGPPTAGRPARRAGGPGRRRAARRTPRTARAVVPAQRLERQREHHRVPQHRFEVEQVTLQPAGLPVLRVVGTEEGGPSGLVVVDEQLEQVGRRSRR